ncbi:unnamed protein product [Echinostoma caproni]|uniref:MFS domain-containing protein n=1 Tax=Echinostoma caproni TaxID=27848 RepID=A0A183BD04_9TREM|nr:unnamed protein product [Echinostoma caproni]
MLDDTLKEKITEMEEEEEGAASKVSLKVGPTPPEERCLLPCLQLCANPISVLLGLFFIMFIQTMVVSGLISSMLTTLERRFNFSTRQVGYMISCYEGSGVLTTVAISFVNGQRHNRLRIVGLSTLLLALGFGLFALPHFLVGPYNPDLSTVPSSSILSIMVNRSNSLSAVVPTTPLAINSSVHTGTTDKIVQTDPIHSLSLSIFCVAMVLAGVGASPLHVLAPTYLWDNLNDKQYPLYSGLCFSSNF